VFDVPSDLCETMLSQWRGWDSESVEAPSELPELLQKDHRAMDRHSLGGRGGGGGGGWRRQFHAGGPRNGARQSRDFNRNGMLKRRASWNAGGQQNRRKTFD